MISAETEFPPSLATFFRMNTGSLLDVSELVCYLNSVRLRVDMLWEVTFISQPLMAPLAENCGRRMTYLMADPMAHNG